MPAAAALLLTVMPWQPAVALLGLVGIAGGGAISVLRRATAGGGRRPAADEGAAMRRHAANALRISAAAVDRHYRQRDAHGLSDLPAVPADRQGREPADDRVAFTLVFAGGAAGKLVCAFIGARIGVVATVWLTEGLTALASWRCCRCR